MAISHDKSRSDLIPPHGGYRETKSYQNAEIVYDATAKFCDKFIDRRSDTCAARLGVKVTNIV